MVSKIKVDEIESSQSGGDITFNTLPKIGGVSNFGRKNYIINGNFDIWQRGTSFTSNGYHADRWNTTVSGTGTTTISRQAFTIGQTDVPNEPKYYARIAKSSGVSGATGGDVMVQRIESVRTLAGQTGTLSFYAKASESTTIDFFLKQHFGTGGSPSSDLDHTPTGVSVTTSWQKFTVTQAFTSISGKTIGSNNDDYLEIIMRIDNGSNASVDFAQIQLEKGSVATDFEIRPIGEELTLCQRYFEVTYDTPPSTWSGDHYYDGVMQVYGSSNYIPGQRFSVKKRTSPTLTFYSKTGTSGQISYNGSSATSVSGYDGNAHHINRLVIGGTSSTNAFLIYEADAEL